MPQIIQDPLEEIIIAVQGIYSRKDQAHDLDHALRVRQWGKKIAEIEQANCVIVELAAILHDIGRSGAISKTHAESGAALAGGILQKNGYSKEIIDAVKQAIRSHSREGYEPETLEAKIVYDADKLDFVGSMGIARLFAWAGKEGKPFFGEDSCESFYRDRIRYYHQHIHTQSAREFFEPLFLYSEAFWVDLQKLRFK